MIVVTCRIWYRPLVKKCEVSTSFPFFESQIKFCYALLWTWWCKVDSPIYYDTFSDSLSDTFCNTFRPHPRSNTTSDTDVQTPFPTSSAIKHCYQHPIRHLQGHPRRHPRTTTREISRSPTPRLEVRTPMPIAKAIWGTNKPVQHRLQGPQAVVPRFCVSTLRSFASYPYHFVRPAFPIEVCLHGQLPECQGRIFFECSKWFWNASLPDHVASTMASATYTSDILQVETHSWDWNCGSIPKNDEKRLKHLGLNGCNVHQSSAAGSCNNDLHRRQWPS